MKNTVLHPWHLLVTILAGAVNREQQQTIEYLRTENQVLREKLGKKRIMLTDDQRRRLAVKGKILGRKALESIATIVTPDTIMRWHRQLNMVFPGKQHYARCCARLPVLFHIWDNSSPKWRSALEGRRPEPSPLSYMLDMW